jgi:hypothetical protein
VLIKFDSILGPILKLLTNNDNLEDNLNPIGRLFHAASTMVCIPASLSQNGPALGTQAVEPVISKVMRASGFKHFRRACLNSFFGSLGRDFL